jgi:hypothetical protein
MRPVMRFLRVRLSITGLLICILVVVVLPIELWVRSVRFAELADDYAQRSKAMGHITRVPVNLEKGKPRLAVVQNGTILPDGPEADKLEQQYQWFREKEEEFGFLARHPWFPVPLPPAPRY